MVELRMIIFRDVYLCVPPKMLCHLTPRSSRDSVHHDSVYCWHVFGYDSSSIIIVNSIFPSSRTTGPALASRDPPDLLTYDTADATVSLRSGRPRFHVDLFRALSSTMP